MFTRTNLFYAYYGIVGIKNIYENIKNENKKKDQNTDDLIDSVLNENINITKKEKKKHSLKKIKINRRIPDKEELNNIFNDFIKNNKIIKVKKELNNNYYEKIVNNINVFHNNNFIYDFTLNKDTYYKILINIKLKNNKDNTKLLFLITDKFKIFKHEIYLNNNNIDIIFNNIYFTENKDIELYLIFKQFNYDLFIESINLIIIKNDNISKKFPILIIKNDIYRQYLFYNVCIFNNYHNNYINF